MKRFLLGTAALVTLVAGVGYSFRSEIVMRLIERRVAANLATHLMRELPDGLHVVLCGAGAPLPDPERSGPCTAVIAGNRLYVVDAGAGSSRVLARVRIPIGEIAGIFLTHFHSDHIDGLGELLLQRWINGSNALPTPVYGPRGVGRIVNGFDVAYGLDRSYRVAHHGEEVAPPSGAGAKARPFRTPRDGEAEILIDEGGLRVSVFRVSHLPVEPAVGYRFDYKGRSVVISGDTTQSANVQKFARGVDLLIHEALAPHLVSLITQGARAAGRANVARITEDILDYHTSPIEAAEIARDAQVGHLLYNHIVPPLVARPLKDVFLRGVRDVYEGPLTIGRDGTLVELPSHGDSIEVSDLL